MCALTYASPLSILVVDDEPMMLRFLGQLLPEHGHTVSTADGGKEALRIFGQQSWHLVLTARAMRGMDGESLPRHLKGISPATAILLMTGFIPQTGCSTIDGILYKPFTIAALAVAVTSALAACLALRQSPPARRA
jgi:CheY-like chemotaxis protein